MSRRPRPQDAPDATITFTYESAYNRIVQPGSYVSLSQYFIAHWLPGISGPGLKILARLRAMGYYDPKTGTQRGDIDIEQKELAGLCGLSLSTLKRAFTDDPILQDYIQRVFRVERDPRNGRIVREHYVYAVKMDDVLIPADRERLDDLLRGPDKGIGDGAAPRGQNEPSGRKPIGQNEPSAVHTDAPTGQNEPSGVQNDLPFKGSLHTPNTEYTSDTPARPRPSASPSSEQEKSEQEKDSSAPWPFDLLDEAGRAPWLDRAEKELRENFGAAVWAKTKEKGRAAIRERRAVSLYLADRAGRKEH